MSQEKLSKYTEFETKYESDITKMLPFVDLVESLPTLKEFVFARGPDRYYTREGSPAGRYRRSQYPMPNGKHFAQWTVKQKPEGAKNSIKRAEPNWRIDDVDPAEVEKMTELLGYRFSFEIQKLCLIYYFDDATLVFYSVKEVGCGDYTYFIEIEVNEETIHQFTEDEAWDVISKYEKILAPIGVSPQKRIRRNLFEMYS